METFAVTVRDYDGKEYKTIVHAASAETITSVLQEMDKSYKKINEMINGQIRTLDQLELGVRAYKAISATRCVTVSEFIGKYDTLEKLQSIRNLGQKGINELVCRIREYFPDYLPGVEVKEFPY